MNKLDAIRGFVRPYAVILVITAIVGLAVYLAIKFATPEITETLVVFLLGTGSTVIGFLFGERASKRKEDK